MHILLITGMDWCEGRLSANCTWISVKLRLNHGDKKMSRLEEKLDKDAVYHLFYSNYSASTLPRKMLKGLETLK